MRRKTLLAILIIFTFAVGSRWMVVKNTTETVAAARDFDVRFDYVLNDFELRSYGEDGVLTSILESPILNQDAVSLMGDVQNPRFTAPRANGETLSLQSQTASVSSDRSKIDFAGDVILAQIDEAGTGMQVRTESLEYMVDTRVVSTSAMVNFQGRGFKMSGTGLTADTRNQIYILHNKVEGQYAP